jgi:hypothetical protein
MADNSNQSDDLVHRIVTSMHRIDDLVHQRDESMHHSGTSMHYVIDQTGQDRKLSS